MAVAAKYLFIFQALDLSDLKANWSETKYFIFWESTSKTAKLFKIQLIARWFIL